MEIKDLIYIIESSWVQLAVAAALAAMFILGYKKGLIRMSASFVSIIVSVVVTKASLPYVVAYVNQNEQLKQALSGHVETLFAVQSSTGTGQSNVDIFYELIGLDRLTEYIGEKAAEFIISVLTFIVLLIVISIVVRILFKVLDLIARVPGLSFLNRMLGAALGLLEALFLVWLLIIVVGILPENELTRNIAAQFSDPDSWLYYIKEANLITRILGAMLP